MGLERMIAKDRASLILMHPTSLPDPVGRRYGIGELGSEAMRFIDFLAESGTLVWQTLPLGHTGFGNSPYQTFSRFAGSPYMISIERLLQDEDLTQVQHDEYVYCVERETQVDCADFGWLFRNKLGKNWNDSHAILRQAYENFLLRNNRDVRRMAFDQFCAVNTRWLTEYSDYMGIKENHDHQAWLEWPKEFCDKHAWRLGHDSLIRQNPMLAKSIDYYKYLQFVFFEQWLAVRYHAHEKGRLIMGDIPWYVGLDSADVWANRDVFVLHPDGQPVCVAGVPPDYFSADGQLWGNPVYNWQTPVAMQWWLDTIEHILGMMDILRIDHFRAIDSFWNIPFHGKETKTAKEGFWGKGPGRTLLLAIKNRLVVAGKLRLDGQLPFVAEDLGFLDPLYATVDDYPENAWNDKMFKVDDHFRDLIRAKDSSLLGGLNSTTGEYSTRKGVDALLLEFNLPNMKVLQFGFEGATDHLAHEAQMNQMMYTGTHDNNTALGWYQEMLRKRPDIRQHLNHDILKELNPDHKVHRTPRHIEKQIAHDFMEIAFSARAVLAGAPMQDLLGLDCESRMNQPGDTKGTWWGWRATREHLDYKGVTEEMRGLNERRRRFIQAPM